MSEFKFACPMCGQHIKCDSDKSGGQVDCPTCFQKLIVPESPHGDPSKFILNAALATNRRYKPSDTTSRATVTARPPVHGVSAAAVALVLLVCAAGGALYAIRDKVMHPPGQMVVANSVTTGSRPSTSPGDDLGWTLNLTDVTIPDAPLTGRINGRTFAPQRMTFQGDTLNFRQGNKRPPDLGLMIVFYVKGGRELAGKSITITTNNDTAPKVLLRWKNDQGQPVSQYYQRGYALRMDFNPLSGNRLTGKVYFCAPDEARSYAAGTFEAEVLPPATAKPKLPRRQHAAR